MDVERAAKNKNQIKQKKNAISERVGDDGGDAVSDAPSAQVSTEPSSICSNYSSFQLNK